MLVVFPTLLPAQADSARGGEIVGTVYDSVARAPVVGAVVQLVAVAANGMSRSAISDAQGAFTFADIPSGRVMLGFQATALDTLALESPVRVVEVQAGKRTRVDLAVPSPSSIMRTVCGRTGASDSTGLLIGQLRDARTRLPIDGGEVRALWQDLLLTTSGIRAMDREVSGAVNNEGWFALCGVPGQSDVMVVAGRFSDSTGAIILSVPTNGVLRRDLALGGSATVHGVVTSDRQQPVTGARIEIAGRNRFVVTDSTGSFRLGDVAAGTFTMQARALGYSPELRPITVDADRDTTIRIMLTSVQKLLDTMHVVAERVYNRDSDGFERRRKAGWGYFFDEKQIAQRKPYDVFSLLQDVPSLTIFRNRFDRTILMRAGLAGDKCIPDVYLDGWRLPIEMIADMDFIVPPEQILGMEVYQANRQPPEFQSRAVTGCGSIVIWTKPRVRGRKR